MSRECMGCHQYFVPRKNVPAQTFCSEKVCQKKRRAEWQRKKLSSDHDYRENQEKANKNWRERHRDYMRNYRQNHPQYREKDRLERRRRHKRAASATAIPAEGSVTAVEKCAVNMDACTSEKLPPMPINSGYFRVCRVCGANAVNMDECSSGYLVQLVVVKEDKADACTRGGLP